MAGLWKGKRSLALGQIDVSQDVDKLSAVISLGEFELILGNEAAAELAHALLEMYPARKSKNPNCITIGEHKYAL